MKRCVFLALTVLVFLSGCSRHSKELRLGTGNTSGTYYAFGNALAHQLREENNALTMTVKNTAGSAANLRLLREGFLQFAIVQSDTLSDAVNGEGVFSQAGTYKGYAAIAGLYTEACQIIVSASSDIQTVRELIGRKVSIGEAESGVRKNAEEILLSYGLTLQMIEPVSLSFTDSAAALERGEIDAFFCTAGAPTTAVSELVGRMEIRLLSLSPESLGNLMALGGGYTPCTIPAFTYPGQADVVSTVGVKAVLVADSSVEKDTVAVITKSLLEKGDKLRGIVNIAIPDDSEYAVKDIPCPFHAGSAAYYAERGISVEVAAGETKSLFTVTQD